MEARLPMAELYPIDERIVQAVAAALAEISTDNGFATDIAEVFRPRRTGEGFAPRDMGVAVRVLSDDPTGEGEMGQPQPPAAWRRMVLGLDVCVRLSERDLRPMDQVLSIVKGDVIAATMADGIWGGLAMNTTVGRQTYYADSRGFEGVVIEPGIDYATAPDDTYENRI